MMSSSRICRVTLGVMFRTVVGEVACILATESSRSVDGIVDVSAAHTSATKASTSGSVHQRKECGVYLAPSTIPGAGMGMFAGNKEYQEGDIVTLGDLVVPVFELDWHNGKCSAVLIVVVASIPFANNWRRIDIPKK